jgi:hypothetical protein
MKTVEEEAYVIDEGNRFLHVHVDVNIADFAFVETSLGMWKYGDGAFLPVMLCVQFCP